LTKYIHIMIGDVPGLSGEMFTNKTGWDVGRFGSHGTHNMELTSHQFAKPYNN
jgi:hypothetical protein